MSPELEKFVNDLADDIRPDIAKIEESIQTTQYHYQDYMVILSMYKGKYPKLFLLALIRAGANKIGVANAWRILYGD